MLARLIILAGILATANAACDSTGIVKCMVPYGTCVQGASVKAASGDVTGMCKCVTDLFTCSPGCGANPAFAAVKTAMSQYGCKAPGSGPAPVPAPVPAPAPVPVPVPAPGPSTPSTGPTCDLTGMMKCMAPYTTCAQGALVQAASVDVTGLCKCVTDLFTCSPGCGASQSFDAVKQIMAQYSCKVPNSGSSPSDPTVDPGPGGTSGTSGGTSGTDSGTSGTDSAPSIPTCDLTKMTTCMEPYATCSQGAMVKAASGDTSGFCKCVTDLFTCSPWCSDNAAFTAIQSSMTTYGCKAPPPPPTPSAKGPSNTSGEENGSIQTQSSMICVLAMVFIGVFA